jgi:CRISPR-associated protein Cas1
MLTFDIEIPISHRITMIYVEYGVLEQDGHAVCVKRGEESLQIPVGNTTVLMLMPGTSVTHAAIQVCAREGCLVLWVGEHGVRCYAAGNPHRDAAALLRQAGAFLSDAKRLDVARKIFSEMFGEPAPLGRSVDQLRGLEGSRVRFLYRQIAKDVGIEWAGRDRTAGGVVNSCISYANASLYGLTEAAILALGYAPSIGFIHTGDPRSFVFDVADVFKFKTVVPLAMRISMDCTDVCDTPGVVRRSCRDLFKREKLVEKIVQFVQDLF